MEDIVAYFSKLKQRNGPKQLAERLLELPDEACAQFLALSINQQLRLLSVPNKQRARFKRDGALAYAKHKTAGIANIHKREKKKWEEELLELRERTRAQHGSYPENYLMCFVDRCYDGYYKQDAPPPDWVIVNRKKRYCPLHAKDVENSK